MITKTLKEIKKIYDETEVQEPIPFLLHTTIEYPTIPDNTSNFLEDYAAYEDSFNNIIVRKTKMRNSLTAEVVDASAENAVKNSKFSQGFFVTKGDLEFLERAEAQANKLKNVNSSIKEFEIANKLDYSAKAKAKAEAKLMKAAEQDMPPKDGVAFELGI